MGGYRPTWTPDASWAFCKGPGSKITNQKPPSYELYISNRSKGRDTKEYLHLAHDPLLGVHDHFSDPALVFHLWSASHWEKKAVLKGLVQTLHRRYSHTYLNVRAPPSTLTIVDRTPEVLLPAITWNNLEERKMKINRKPGSILVDTRAILSTWNPTHSFIWNLRETLSLTVNIANS